MNRVKIVDSSGSDSDDGQHQQKNSSKPQHQPQHKAAKLRHVEAVATESGTELPVKLNTKVFIDGLPFHEPNDAATSGTVEEQLATFCSAWKVGKVVKLLKRDGQGFGYLAFRSPHSVDTAIRVLNGKKFLGRALRIEEPKPPKSMRGDQQLAGDTGDDEAVPAHMRDHKNVASPQGLKDSEDYTRQVLLSDLPAHSQPDILREMFLQYCPALEPHVQKIKMTSRNRKAFITMDDEGRAQQLAEFLHGFTLLGRRVDACMAQPPGTAQWAPAKMRVAAVEKAARAAAGVVPAGFNKPAEGSDGNAAAAAAAATHGEDDGFETVPTQKQSAAATKQLKQEIVGSNAKKKYPMPLLIGGGEDAAADASAAPSAKTEKLAGKIRQRDDPDSGSSRFSTAKGPRVVYVANVGSDVTQQRLRAHFGSAGTVRKCELHSIGGAPSGIASVEFALPIDARRSVERLNGSLLGGQAIEVELDGEGAAGVHGGDQAQDEEKFVPYSKASRELDDEDLDEFARHYGVKDRKKFLAEYATGGDADADAAAAAPEAEEGQQARHRPKFGGKNKFSSKRSK